MMSRSEKLRAWCLERDDAPFTVGAAESALGEPFRDRAFYRLWHDKHLILVSEDQPRGEYFSVAAVFRVNPERRAHLKEWVEKDRELEGKSRDRLSAFFAQALNQALNTVLDELEELVETVGFPEAVAALRLKYPRPPLDSEDVG